jgi:hypothetical protein
MPSSDFDFLHGSWRIHNRRLRQLFSDSSDWYEFEGAAVERPLWDGQANIEEYDADTPTGRIRGLALRLYNPRAEEWIIHWAGSATGTLDSPLTGEFNEGRGVFHGQDLHEGRTILVRFIWTQGDAERCRWEQAFSRDGGTVWETNWIMDFTRVVDVPT